MGLTIDDDIDLICDGLLSLAVMRADALDNGLPGGDGNLDPRYGHPASLAVSELGPGLDGLAVGPVNVLVGHRGVEKAEVGDGVGGRAGAGQGHGGRVVHAEGHGPGAVDGDTGRGNWKCKFV